MVAKRWTTGLGLAISFLLALSACAPSATGPAAKPSTAAAGAPTAVPEARPPAPVAADLAPADGFDERAVASFYRGKTLKLIVGLPPGGGYDTYARAIARFLGKYVPG